MNSLVIFFAALIVLGCAAEEEEVSPDFNIPGTFSISCMQEGIADDVKADTTTLYSVKGDSIRFSTEMIGNCCGWMDSMRLAAVGDTIRLISISKDNIEDACDCNCLFEIRMDFLQEFFEKTDKAILFWNGRVLNYFPNEQDR